MVEHTFCGKTSFSGVAVDELRFLGERLEKMEKREEIAKADIDMRRSVQKLLDLNFCKCTNKQIKNMVSGEISECITEFICAYAASRMYAESGLYIAYVFEMEIDARGFRIKRAKHSLEGME